MLILWTMRWTGLAGPGWAAALVIAAGCSATVAIAVTIRALSGEDPARRALPFLALAPTAIWVATSMDALFLGVASWAVALCALSTPGASPLPPGGRTPLLSSTVAVAVDKGVHRLWITSLDVSGVTRGEVERIWVPYAAWIAAAACVHRPLARGPLIAQAATALALEAVVGSPW